MNLPVYIQTLEAGGFPEKVSRLRAMLKQCGVCPRLCGVNRTRGELGYCETGVQASVASAGPHFGEEDPLVGRGGSGTIFFTSCNLKCVFCQNYEISNEMEGVSVDSQALGRMMLRLQDMGCYNINFVTPSHVAPQIAESVLWAARNGLRIPLVYNTGGYDGLETLALLDGIIDIYMPDIKFMNPETSRVLMSAEDYPTVVQAAVKEMHRQVGDLVIDSTGLAQRGLLVRHLVMPGNAADTRLVMRFLAREISPKTYVNIMDQYRPCGRAKKFDAIARAISTREYADALNAAEEEGMRRLDRRARRFTV